MTEFAWVIERGDSQPGAPTYWSGPDGAWSQDHMDAVRFARKQDAERVACRLGQGYHRVCEHGWSALKQDADVATEGQDKPSSVCTPSPDAAGAGEVERMREEAAATALRTWDTGQQGAHGGEQANRTAAAIRAIPTGHRTNYRGGRSVNIEDWPKGSTPGKGER